MGIKRIEVNQVNIPQVFVPNWQTQHPNVDHLVPPVVLQIGNPIVDMPGCVKAHQDNQYHVTGLPKDKNLVEKDPDKAMIVCDATVPSYDAMNYEPEQLTIIRDIPPPEVEPPPDPPGAPEVPDTGNVKTEVECPAPNQPRIGDVAQNQKEKVSGYELRDGICVILYEDIGPVEQYLPSAQVATTTAVIATVAGASALLAKPLADLLLRVFRPAIKKALTKANSILGRKTVKPSRSEIQTEEYRKKRGLPSVKKRR